DARLRARHAGARRSGRRRHRHVARPDAVGRRLVADLVDGAVAVVVDAVARLGDGIDLADADERAALALLGAERAREDVALPAGGADVRRTVVDGAVAVVVLAVARLEHLVLHAHVRARAHDLVALADRRPRVQHGGALAVGITEADDADLRIAGEVI